MHIVEFKILQIFNALKSENYKVEAAYSKILHTLVLECIKFKP